MFSLHSWVAEQGGLALSVFLFCIYYFIFSPLSRLILPCSYSHRKGQQTAWDINGVMKRRALFQSLSLLPVCMWPNSESNMSWHYLANFLSSNIPQPPQCVAEAPSKVTVFEWTCMIAAICSSFTYKSSFTYLLMKPSGGSMLRSSACTELLKWESEFLNDSLKLNWNEKCF